MWKPAFLAFVLLPGSIAASQGWLPLVEWPPAHILAAGDPTPPDTTTDGTVSEDVETPEPEWAVSPRSDAN